jgi:hypothetical protein
MATTALVPRGRTGIVDVIVQARARLETSVVQAPRQRQKFCRAMVSFGRKMRGYDVWKPVGIRHGRATVTGQERARSQTWAS